MNPDPRGRHRRSIRLQKYDYAQPGAYFFTVCTQGRASLFGRIRDGEMHLNEAGQMVWKEWNSLTDRFTRIVPDTFVVMPNHVHGILMITRPVETDAYIPEQEKATPAIDREMSKTAKKAPTLGQIVGTLKSCTTVEFVRGIKSKGWPLISRRLWQRNYYEHVIRNEDSLKRIRQYIVDNPLTWHVDRDNPNRIGEDDVWDTLFTVEINRPPDMP